MGKARQKRILEFVATRKVLTAVANTCTALETPTQAELYAAWSAARAAAAWAAAWSAVLARAAAARGAEARAAAWDAARADQAEWLRQHAKPCFARVPAVVKEAERAAGRVSGSTWIAIEE